MKEFMLYVRNEEDHLAHLDTGKQQEFLEKCRVYINKLTKDGKLISAQPMEKQGKILSGSEDTSWRESPLNESGEIIVGYYHIMANNLEEAISIAKQNPEFAYTNKARVEVRPIKMKEESTGFVYPKEEARV